MSKQEPTAAAAAAPFSNLPFDECSFSPAEAQRILRVGKTRLFDELLRNGELESYLDGTRRIITGRSIKAYRERKLAEARKRPTEHLRKAKAENENGATGRPRAP